MKVLAIDPGKYHHSYSSWRNRELLNYGKVTRDRLGFWKLLIEDHDSIYVEDQFLGKTAERKNRSVKDMFALVRASTELLTLAKLSGKPVHLVSPRKWQSKVLKASPRLVRKELKKLSKMIASEIAKEKIVDHDIADAICMGLAVVSDALNDLEDFYSQEVSHA